MIRLGRQLAVLGGAFATMSAAVCVSAPSQLCVDQGVASQGSIKVHGAFVVGASGEQIKEQIQKEAGFAIRYADRIRKLAEKSDMDPCTLGSILRALAMRKLTAEQLPEALDTLFAEHLTNVKIEERLAQVDEVVRERVGELNATGEVERARSLYGCLGVGIVAGDGVEIGGDAILGMPKSQLRALVQEMRGQYADHLSELNRLSAELHVNGCAIAGFLKQLQEKPPADTDDLPSLLTTIAEKHVALVKSWRSLTSPDAKVKTARDAAKRALDRGDHASAEALLTEALDELRRRDDLTKPLHSDLARVQGELGHLASIQLHFKKAADLFEMAYMDAEAADELPEKIEYKSLQAAALQDSGDYDKAERTFRNGKDLIGRDGTGNAAEQGAVLLTNLAALYYARSTYRKAEREFQAALDVVDSLPGLDLARRAEWQSICENGLAQSALGLSNLSEADEHFGRALRLMETAFGTEAPELAGPTANLARLRAVQGRFPEAEEFYGKAIRLCETAPAGSPFAHECSVVRNNLAGLYFETRRYTDAEQLWSRVLAEYKTLLGKEHPLTLGVMQNLAAVKRRLGDLDGAMKFYEEALRPWETAIDDEKRNMAHMVVVTLLDGEGDVLVSQNRLEEAAENYGTALVLARENLKKGQKRKLSSVLHSAPQDEADKQLVVAAIRNDLGVVRERQSRLEEAAQEYSVAREVFRARLGILHPKYGAATGNLARVRGKLGHREEAVERYLEAIEVARAGHDDSKVAFRSRKLAELYLSDCRLDEARERLQTSRGLYVGLYGEDNAKTKKVAELLASLGQRDCIR